MDYNNIILELLDRIKTLENKVTDLENRLNNININNDDNKVDVPTPINNNVNEEPVSQSTYQEENYNAPYQFKNDMLGGDKYIRLTNYLKSSNENCINLSFSNIESILGFSLNASARKHRAQWSNTTTISFPCSWIKAGYKVAAVDIANEEVEFIKDYSRQENNNYPNTGDKYYKLNNYLKGSNQNYIRLTFKEIENILGFELSESARMYQAFWSNTRSHSIACSWLNAGYKNINTNLTQEYVEFRKL
jgi:hypothetical protein